MTVALLESSLGIFIFRRNAATAYRHSCFVFGTTANCHLLKPIRFSRQYQEWSSVCWCQRELGPGPASCVWLLDQDMESDRLLFYSHLSLTALLSFFTTTQGSYLLKYCVHVAIFMARSEASLTYDMKGNRFFKPSSLSLNLN